MSRRVARVRAKGLYVTPTPDNEQPRTPVGSKHRFDFRIKRKKTREDRPLQSHACMYGRDEETRLLLSFVTISFNRLPFSPPSDPGVG